MTAPGTRDMGLEGTAARRGRGAAHASRPGGAIARLVLGMTGAHATPGGIAASNHSVIDALGEISRERRIPLHLVAYLEKDDARPPRLDPQASFAGCSGSKVRFARTLVPHLGRETLALFDHVDLALPALPWARFRGLRTVIFAHGSEASWRLKRSSAWSYRAAALCLTNSPFTLRALEKSVPGVRARACELGLPPGHAVAAPAPAPAAAPPPEMEDADGARRPLGDRVLLLVARMDPTERKKGHRELLSVLPAVAAARPEVQVALVGGGADREDLREMVRGLGVGSRVFLPGHVPDAALADLYARCFAFVMPSRQEGFGLAYLEAMARGKPCIAHRDQGCEGVVLDGKTGILVDLEPGTDGLRDAILRLLADPAAARAMGEAGLRLLRERFTPEQHRARVRQAVEGLLP